MALITHPATGFPVGDPDLLPLERASLPSPADLAAAMRPLILSTSGWRKVFAADGDEESPTAKVSRADLVLAGAAALAFSRFLKSRASALGAGAALGAGTALGAG
ncbi:MAG: hypothetical protein Q8M76_14620, partial [Spirochaetaceae bacterium]|nr:hypothetical protein [Spirochaetaceae bacterium]